MRTVVIDIKTGKGTYGDVIEASEYLTKEYGSAANAAVQMIRDSGKFARARAAIRKAKVKAKKATARAIA